MFLIFHEGWGRVRGNQQSFSFRGKGGVGAVILLGGKGNSGRKWWGYLGFK